MKYIRPINEDNASEEARLGRAKHADLITLPEGITGTNCANCKFIDLETKMCKHKEVDQKVAPNMCCVYWDAEGVKREWEK